MTEELENEDTELYDDGDEDEMTQTTTGSSSSPSDSDEDSDEDEQMGTDDRTQSPRIENEIEGDFDRLINTIRTADGISGTGMLSKVWDLKLEEKSSDWRDDLREATGIGRRKVKKKRDRRVGPVLSQQVRALIGEGNQAYVDNNVAEAIQIMQEVIRIEPRAVSAWAVLAQCQADNNEPVKALQLRIMAAHLMHDPDEWYNLATQSRALGYTHQALYCYSKVYSLDPTNVDALWDRAILAKEIGQLKTARSALLAILRQIPHDLSVLEELRPILIELSDIGLCASLFQQAFDSYQTLYPEGKAVDADTGEVVPGGGFGLMEVLVLADLYNSLADYENATGSIKKGCRWLQGRSNQRYWDTCEDDREFDVALDYGQSLVRDGVLAPGMYPLDVNARHRLAVARIKTGDLDEGKMHAAIVLSQDVLDYSPLFGEIADAYFERQMYTEAVRIYETLGGDPGTSSLYVLLQAAACRRMKGDLREAAEIYEHVIAADPTHKDAKMKLAEIYEILDEPRKALELVTQVINARKRRNQRTSRQGSVVDSPAPSQHMSLFEEKTRGKEQRTSKTPRHVTRELEAQKEKEVLQGYKLVEELRPRMLAGEDTALNGWLLEAEKLVEAFRETRRLFLSTRLQGFRGMFRGAGNKKTDELNEDKMASRLQLEIDRDKSAGSSRAQNLIDVFRGVSFDDWLRLIMQYAFMLAQRGQHELADEILRHIQCSNAYQTRAAQDTLRLAIMTCAVHSRRHPVVVEQARKLINVHQFNNEPVRILLACLASGLHQTDAFIASPFQKHMLREVKFADLAINHREQLKWNPRKRRFGVSGGSKAAEDDDDDAGEEHAGDEESQQMMDLPKPPTKPNPNILALYGQFCITAKSYQSAIFYLLQAYEHCPYDPVICLCLAISSVGRAMQRQADNRHHLITQGLAFLSKYRDIRGAEMDDVDFNFGRLFHQLGLFSNAARHYERVLEMTENRMKVDANAFGLAKEAAYNLSLIYVTTGAGPLAQKLYRRWLSL